MEPTRDISLANGFVVADHMFRRWQIAVVVMLVAVGTSIVWLPWFAAWRTQTLLDIGQLDAAEVWLARSEWLGLEAGRANFYRATLASRRGQVDEAAGWLRSAASAGYPKDQVRRAQQVLLAQAGRFEEIGSDWRGLLASPGADADGIYRGFIIYALACGLIDDAEKVARRWQQQSPDRVDPYRFAGLIATINSDWEAATLAYQRGLQQQPRDSQLLAALAGCLSQQLKFAEAAQVWQRLLDEEPESIDAVMGLADTRSKLGDASAARQILMSHEALVQKNAAALALLGRICLEQGNAADAVGWYRRAAEQQPESTDIRRNLAQAHRLAGQPEAATALEPLIEEGEKALSEIRKLNGRLSQQPGDADLRYRLAELTWRWKSRREGINWMRVVLRVDPEHAEARRFLAKHATGEDSGEVASPFGFLDSVPGTP